MGYIDKILLLSSAYYYTDIIMVLIALFSALFGWKNRNKNSQVKWLLIYPLASALETIWSYANFFFIREEPGSKNMNAAMNLFLLLEFLLLFIFYRNIIANGVFKRTIIAIGIFYLVYCAVRFIFIHNVFENISIFFAIHAVFILALGLTWIFSIFSIKPENNLTNNPALWVTSGTFVYFLCTIPLFVAEEFVFNPNGIIIESGIYSINYICYSILFILLTRAFVCNPIEKQSSL